MALQYLRAMATTPQIPPPNPPQPPMPMVASAAHVAAENPGLDAGSESALVPLFEELEQKSATDDLEVHGPVALLPIELDVTIPVRNFRVRDLLSLEGGHLIETQWHNGDDVPLAAANVQLAWSEFEVIESDLAVRITRLP